MRQALLLQGATSTFASGLAPAAREMLWLSSTLLYDAAVRFGAAATLARLVEPASACPGAWSSQGCQHMVVTAALALSLAFVLLQEYVPKMKSNDVGVHENLAVAFQRGGGALVCQPQSFSKYFEVRKSNLISNKSAPT